MDAISQVGTRFDRRNELIPYDKRKDQHLKLLDIHALRFLGDPKTVGELSRHMQHRLSQRDGLADEYVALRWLESAKNRHLVRAVAPELWQLSTRARLKSNAGASVKATKRIAKVSSLAATNSTPAFAAPSNGTAAATAKAGAAKTATVKAAAGGAAKTAAVKGASVTAAHNPALGLVLVPPLAYRRHRRRRRSLRSWEKHGEPREWARWNEAGLLTRVSEREEKRRMQDKYAELARAYYLEWAKFPAPAAGGPKTEDLSRRQRRADRKAREKLAKLMKLPDAGTMHELLDEDWRDADGA